MSYTIKKLADLSGVSVRTLHWYDEIGLLKPKSYGSQGYRHYDREQLFLLQQILFYRELGFKLEDIKSILDSPKFDKIQALVEHRKSLEQQIQQRHALIQTIDKTLRDIKGEEAMNDDQIYLGFNEWVKTQNDVQISLGELNSSPISEVENIVFTHIRPASERADWKKEDWDRVMKEGDKIYRDLVDAMDSGKKPSSQLVQRLIELHYAHAEHFHVLTPQVYKALAELYQSKEQFREQLVKYSQKLPEFMASAMFYFVSKKS